MFIIHIYIYCIYTLHHVWMYHCKNNDPKRKGFLLGDVQCLEHGNLFHLKPWSQLSFVSGFIQAILWTFTLDKYPEATCLEEWFVSNLSINIFSAGIFIQFSKDVGKISSSNIIHTKNITYIMVVITICCGLPYPVRQL